MSYPAYDLAQNSGSLGYTAYCEYLPNEECVDYETVSMNNTTYEYGEEEAAVKTAIIQARIYAKTHENLRYYIGFIQNDFDGKTVTLNGTTYEIFVNSIAYQGFRQTEAGNFRYAVVTMTLHY